MKFGGIPFLYRRRFASEYSHSFLFSSILLNRKLYFIFILWLIQMSKWYSNQQLLLIIKSVRIGNRFLIKCNNKNCVKWRALIVYIVLCPSEEGRREIYSIFSLHFTSLDEQFGIMPNVQILNFSRVLYDIPMYVH